MRLCRMKSTPFSISQDLKTEMPSRRLWQACEIIRLSGSGNYTLWRRWDVFIMTNALSNTVVVISSKAWYGRLGCHSILSISCMPLSVVLTAIHHRNAPIPQCTLRTASGRHRNGKSLEEYNVLIDNKSMLRVGDTLVH
jgi:hypothetical protein